MSLNWSHPLIPQRADPHLSLHDGRYWFTASVPGFDAIELRSAARIEDLPAAAPRIVWTRHAQGPASWHIWAPELHRVDGRWLIQVRQVNLIDCDQNLRNPSIVI